MNRRMRPLVPCVFAFIGNKLQLFFHRYNEIYDILFDVLKIYTPHIKYIGTTDYSVVMYSFDRWFTVQMGILWLFPDRGISELKHSIKFYVCNSKSPEMYGLSRDTGR